MSIDQVAPVELPTFDAKTTMNEELESGLTNAEQSSNGSPRSANSPRELHECWRPEPRYVFHPTNAYDEVDATVVDVVWHPKMFDRDRTGPTRLRTMAC